MKAWGSGDEAALARLAEYVYPELRLMARRYMKNEGQGNTLQAALVNEVYLRLVDVIKVEWHARAQFFAMAAQMMRRILVDAARDYPKNWVYHNQLALIYVDGGQYEEGLSEAQEAIRLGPDSEAPYRRQLDAYICLDRLPEAKQAAEQLRKLKIGGSRIHQRFLEMAYVGDDAAGIAKEIQWLAGKPEEYLSFGLQAADRNVHGQRRESHKLYERAAEMARRRDLETVAAEFDEADARADAIAGNCQTARHLGRPALALAICGDAAQAEKLAAETSKLFPNGTIWNAVQLPEIRAAIALKRDRPEESVGSSWHPLLRTSAPTSRRATCVEWLICASTKAPKRRLSSAKSWIIRAPVGELHGCTPIGDCITRRLIWGSRGPIRLRATQRMRRRRSRASSICGRMPTATCR